MKTLVQEIMTKSLQSVSIFDTIIKAEILMKEDGYKHISVTEDGKLVGIITQKKISEYKLRELYENHHDINVDDDKILDFDKIVKRAPTVVFPEDSIGKVVELMIKKKIDYIPVVDWEKNLLGCVSFFDVLLFINKKIQDGVL